MTDRIINRAFAAYYKGANPELDASQIKASAISCNGLFYVRLMKGSAPLAVYRIRTINGGSVLKRMKRFPAEVAHV